MGEGRDRWLAVASHQARKKVTDLGGITLKLTRKQCTRLEELANASEDDFPDRHIIVTDWHSDLRGPVIRFTQTGKEFVVTRDGGLQKHAA